MGSIRLIVELIDVFLQQFFLVTHSIDDAILGRYIAG